MLYTYIITVSCNKLILRKFYIRSIKVIVRKFFVAFFCYCYPRIKRHTVLNFEEVCKTKVSRNSCRGTAWFHMISERWKSNTQCHSAMIQKDTPQTPSISSTATGNDIKAEIPSTFFNFHVLWNFEEYDYSSVLLYQWVVHWAIYVPRTEVNT